MSPAVAVDVLGFQHVQEASPTKTASLDSYSKQNPQELMFTKTNN